MTKKPLKALLIAGDAETDALPVLRQLEKEGFDPVCERVANPEDTIRSLDNNQWDIILSDYALPGFTALDVLKLLQNKDPDIPFIVIADAIGEAAAVETIRSGAHDFFVKDNLQGLGEAVRRELAATRTRREKRQYIKETEQRRRESETKFRVITEFSPDAIFITNQQGVYTYVNPAATQLLGYTREELLGRNITDISVPGQIEKNRQIFQQILTKKRLYVEIEIVGKDGRTIPTDLNAVLLPNGEVYGSCRDMTEPKQAERQIQESERLLTFAIQQLPVPVIIADAPDVIITHYNQAVVDMLAVTPRDVREIPLMEHRDFWPTFYPDGTAYWVDDLPLTQAIKEGKATRNREIIVRQNGRNRWISASAAPLYNDEGKIVAGIVVFPEITQIKMAEETLKKKEALHRLAQQVAHIGHWEIDGRNGEVIWSEEILNIFRLDPETGPPPLDEHDAIIDPRDYSVLEQAVAAGLEQGTPFDLSFRIRRADNTPGWLHARGKAQTNQDGQVVKLFGTAQDITVRKQIEEEREKAYHQTEALLNAARAVLAAKNFTAAARAIFDIGAEAVSATGGYFALLREDGKNNEIQFLESGGRPCSVDPDLPMPVRGLRERVYQEKRAVYDNDFPSSTYRALMPEGHLELENVLFAPLILDGQVVGLFGFANKAGKFTDEDAHLVDSLAEIAAVALREGSTRKALEQSEEAYRTLFNSSADALLTLEPPAWKIASWNPAALRLFGVQNETEFTDRAPWAFSPLTQPDGRSSVAKAREIMETAIQEGHHFFEWQHQRPDGSKFSATVMLTRIDLKEKTVMQASIRDMTEYKNLQDQIAQADRLSTMGMLAAGVAHEINNPLAYILYNLESLTEELPDLVAAMREVQALLRKLADDETAGADGKPGINKNLLRRLNPVMLQDVLDRFQDALSGSYRIRDIARGLGTFSRVEKDRLVSVDLMHVIEVAINMAYNEIKYRARLVKDYGKTPPVIASEGRLSQVFLNLLINATHAIEEGRGKENEIRITTWSDAGNVYAEVRDTGNGIAPENMDKLFEPFFSTKQVGTGSGLGLPISKSIIESYGGSIAVQSEPGRGTCFTIRLPLGQQKPQEVKGKSGMDTDAEVKKRGRILIVDDEKGIRGAMVRMLREHETVQAANGYEAKEILEKDQAFDLVLCDMMMPDFSGMDLHQWMTDACPVLAEQLIFITGGAFTPRAKEYLSTVNNLRLEKPFDKADFQKIVNDHVQSIKPTGSS